MTDTIRVGIVGSGKIAWSNHIPSFLAESGFDITALCDIRSERLEATKKEFADLRDVACFSRDADLYASGLVDAVAICTPNDCHHPQTLAACQAGLHVLCEKPMAASLEHATAMIQAAHQAGKVLQINQSMRFNAQYQTLVDLVHQGAIGEPFHVRCIRGGAGTPNEGWSPGADWFVQKARDGGLLLDIGIHMADVMRMIMGNATTVAGLVDTRRPDIDVPDNVNALFRYQNGGTGMLELSWTMPGGAGLLEVYGTKGRLRMGFAGKGRSLELWQDGKSGEAATSFPEATPRDNSQRVFGKAIRGQMRSLTPGEYGRRALALCLAIQEASDTGTFAAVQRFPEDETV